MHLLRGRTQNIDTARLLGAKQSEVVCTHQIEPLDSTRLDRKFFQLTLLDCQTQFLLIPHTFLVFNTRYFSSQPPTIVYR